MGQRLQSQVQYFSAGSKVTKNSAKIMWWLLKYVPIQWPLGLFYVSLAIVLSNQYIYGTGNSGFTLLLKTFNATNVWYLFIIIIAVLGGYLLSTKPKPTWQYILASFPAFYYALTIFLGIISGELPILGFTAVIYIIFGLSQLLISLRIQHDLDEMKRLYQLLLQNYYLLSTHVTKATVSVSSVIAANKVRATEEAQPPQPQLIEK